jgi:hypothetical protein
LLQLAEFADWVIEGSSQCFAFVQGLIYDRAKDRANDGGTKAEASSECAAS